MPPKEAAEALLNAELEAKFLLFKLMVVENTQHDISWFDPKKHSLDMLVDYIEWRDYEESEEGRQAQADRDLARDLW